VVVAAAAWLKLGAVAMQDALSALQSSNWVDACRALSVVQQLAAHHKSELQQHLCVHYYLRLQLGAVWSVAV
jgi:hypothetical protein